VPQFKDREEYEKWKAEKLRQAAEKTQQGAQEDKPPEPLNQAPERKADTAGAGLLPVGELFSVSWEIYRRRFGPLVGLYLISILLFIIPLAVLLGGSFALGMLFPDAKYVLIGIGGTLGLFISCITVFWGTAGLTVAVTDESLGVSSALAIGWAKVWSFIWLFSILGFVVTGGLLLFFLPGMLFLVWFSFAQFILAEEDVRGMNAMLKSREYVKGYGGEVFLRMFLIWIIAAVVSMVPFIGPILSIVFFPFVLIYLYQIYADLKAMHTVRAFSASTGEKAKWVLVSLLGYIVLPVMIIALVGAAFLGPLLALRTFQAAPWGLPPIAGQQQSSDVVRPANFSDLLGTWTGREINREAGWTFTFSEGYNVQGVSPSGEWYRGKASIHFDLGITDGVVRVPPGAGILDIDVIESSLENYAGKTSLGAYEMRDNTLKICGGEPGKTKRPASFEPSGGMRCFELTRTSGPSASQQQPPGQVLPGHQNPASESDAAEAREAFKRCVAAFTAGNMAEAKKYVAKTALSEMEQTGMFSMAMGMMAGLNIDEFAASTAGDHITFTKSEKQGEMSSSMSVTMVKEDGQWKLGK
jgi:hypothetical protein